MESNTPEHLQLDLGSPWDYRGLPWLNDLYGWRGFRGFLWALPLTLVAFVALIMTLRIFHIRFVRRVGWSFIFESKDEGGDDNPNDLMGYVVGAFVLRLHVSIPVNEAWAAGYILRGAWQNQCGLRVIEAKRDWDYVRRKCAAEMENLFSSASLRVDPVSGVVGVSGIVGVREVGIAKAIVDRMQEISAICQAEDGVFETNYHMLAIGELVFAVKMLSSLSYELEYIPTPDLSEARSYLQKHAKTGSPLAVIEICHIVCTFTIKIALYKEWASEEGKACYLAGMASMAAILRRLAVSLGSLSLEPQIYLPDWLDTTSSTPATPAKDPTPEHNTTAT